MTKAPLGKQEKEIIENYLSGYASNRLILGAERYLELYSESKDGYLSLIDRDMLNEAPLAKSRMFSVRHFYCRFPTETKSCCFIIITSEEKAWKGAPSFWAFREEAPSGSRTER